MAVFRVEKTSNYTVMSNYHLKEKEMSLKAKGLLSLMLSLPDDWDYSIAGLISICKENETSIKSTLDELKQFGYLEVIKYLPNQTKTGRIEYEYIVYEQPKKVQEIEKQDIEKQGVENLGVEFLGIENQGQLNTNILNTNKSNTNKSNTNKLNNNNNNNIMSSSKEHDDTQIDNIKDIIDYLNKKIGSNYKTTSKNTQRYIRARLNEGFNLSDFITVIDKQYDKWIGTEWQQYLRPQTLFGTNFESYLNAPKKQSSTITSGNPFFDLLREEGKM